MYKNKILIVEDEVVVAEDVRACLVRSGYDVSESVETGEEALELLKKTKVDLVLMDIFLAGPMDGIDTAGAITETVDVPIVYLTAYSDEEILERARLTEPFGYMVKPFERRELVSTIEMALYKHEKMTEKANRFKKLEEQNHILHEKIRRISSDEDQIILLGYGFSYDRSNKNLLYFDKEVHLTKKESLFIHLLAENIGNTVPYGRIESYLWGDCGVDENNFRIFLWRLRSKVGHELVKNTMGIGYRIERPQYPSCKL